MKFRKGYKINGNAECCEQVVAVEVALCSVWLDDFNDVIVKERKSGS